MKTALISSIVLLALAALPAGAKPPGAVENARETEPSLLTLPSLAGGTLALQKCSTCKRQTFTLDAAARYYIGRQEVSYVEFKRHVDTHPQDGVLVVTSVPENIVTRLVAQ